MNEHIQDLFESVGTRDQSRGSHGAVKDRHVTFLRGEGSDKDRCSMLPVNARETRPRSAVL